MNQEARLKVNQMALNKINATDSYQHRRYVQASVYSGDIWDGRYGYAAGIRSHRPDPGKGEAQSREFNLMVALDSIQE